MHSTVSTAQFYILAYQNGELPPDFLIIGKGVRWNPASQGNRLEYLNDDAKLLLLEISDVVETDPMSEAITLSWMSKYDYTPTHRTNSEVVETSFNSIEEIVSFASELTTAQKYTA